MTEAQEKRSGRGRLWRWLAGGVLGIAVLLLLAMVAQTAAIGLMNMTLISYKGYQTGYVYWTRTVDVSGHFGPGFARQLGREMAWRWVERIDVYGPSADPDEALAAARLIEKHGGLTVTVRQVCVPGCVAMLLAGEKRLAPYDLTIDLADEAEFDASRGEGPALRAYLLRKGVPAEYFVPLVNTPDGGTRPITAPELLRAGLLTGLVDEAGRPVSLEDAEARLAAAQKP